MSAPAGATRRCPACATWRPDAEFQRLNGPAGWGKYAKCESCRAPFSPEQLAEGRALFESGQPLRVVAAALGRGREDAANRVARAEGWSTEARAAAKAPAPGACRVRGCAEPQQPGRHRCGRHERARRNQERYMERGRERAIALRAGPATVTIRCHVCTLHRTSTLTSVCPRCGASGATPLSALDVTEAAA